MKTIFTLFLLLSVVCSCLTACSGVQEKEKAAGAVTQAAAQESAAAKETVQSMSAGEASETQPPTSSQEPAQVSQENEQPEHSEEQPQEEVDQMSEQERTLHMTIGGAPVSVAWEDNDTVAALKALCREQTLTINMSMYGGFEQVGSVGVSLPRSDVQTTTSAGDIVLYSGNQIVVFYGSHSWAYTRLGHITDQGADGMAQLLANGDTTVTIRLMP